MSENSIKGIMDTTMEKIRAMVDADTIIGDPIKTGDITIIPISKVSFGLATGGSDFSAKSSNLPLFGGGGGAGVTISPVAFIVINGTETKILQIYKESSSTDRAIALVPDLIDKIVGMFKKNTEREEIEIEE